MADCGCIQKGKFSFLIEAISCDLITYQDFSTWADGPGCSIPDTYDITIKSGTYEKTVQVNTKGPTDISWLMLDDGIYEISVNSCGIPQKRSVAIIPRLLCCLDTYINKFDSDKRKADQLSSYIHQIEASAKFNMNDIADTYFRKAKNIIENLNCDC